MDHGQSRTAVDPYNFTLTTNELLAVLRVLRIKTILGLPADPYASLSRSETVAVLADGMHRFFHRRGFYEAYMHPDRPAYRTLGEMRKVMGICGFCTTSLVINRQTPASPAEWQAWHYCPEIDPRIAQYTPVRENRHHFQLIEMNALRTALRHDRPGTISGGDSVALPAETVAALRQNPAAPVDGLDQDHPVRNALARSGKHVWLAAMRYRDQQSLVIGYLYTDKTVWLLDEESGKVLFIPCTDGSMLDDPISEVVGLFAAG